MIDTAMNPQIGSALIAVGGVVISVGGVVFGVGSSRFQGPRQMLARDIQQRVDEQLEPGYTLV
jgi:hypothetical protein